MAKPPLLAGALRRAADAIRQTGGFAPDNLSKEQARALPSSRGGEEPRQLQVARTQVYTYFTRIGGTHLLYSAENWVRITMALENAGPVAVGTDAALEPVLSGRGILLNTQPGPSTTWVLARGTRVYTTAANVNRVAVTIEPIPWLEQLDLDLARVGAAVSQSAQTIVQGLAAAIASLRGAGPPMAPPSPVSSVTGLPMSQIPVPQGVRSALPRLTPLTGTRRPGKVR